MLSEMDPKENGRKEAALFAYVLCCVGGG
eukprot:SAG31_NODE_1694_length_7509_cov_14.080432_7_plen_28_part_01